MHIFCLCYYSISISYFFTHPQSSSIFVLSVSFSISSHLFPVGVTYFNTSSLDPFLFCSILYFMWLSFSFPFSSFYTSSPLRFLFPSRHCVCPSSHPPLLSCTFSSFFCPILKALYLSLIHI